MAKVENVVLDTLNKKVEDICSKLHTVKQARYDAENAHNRFRTEQEILEKDLKQVQDAIALLSKAKKGKKDDQ